MTVRHTGVDPHRLYHTKTAVCFASMTYHQVSQGYPTYATTDRFRIQNALPHSACVATSTLTTCSRAHHVSMLQRVTAFPPLRYFPPMTKQPSESQRHQPERVIHTCLHPPEAFAAPALRASRLGASLSMGTAEFPPPHHTPDLLQHHPATGGGTKMTTPRSAKTHAWDWKQDNASHGDPFSVFGAPPPKTAEKHTREIRGNRKWFTRTLEAGMARDSSQPSSCR